MIGQLTGELVGGGDIKNERMMPENQENGDSIIGEILYYTERRNVI